MHLPIDILSCIFNHLDDYEIFRLCQVNKFFSQLQRKDKLWSLVLNNRYPDNDLIEGLTCYQNFKRLTLVKKFLELNKHLLSWYKYYIHHSETPKRLANRAMFIPIVGFNHAHCNDRKVLPASLKYAFASVNVRIPQTPRDWEGSDIVFSNWLLSTDNLFLRPRKGDVLAFVELGGDYSDILLIYDGKEIKYSWGHELSSLPCLPDLNWPAIAIDYWKGQPVVPSEIKQQWIQNMTYKPLPEFLKSKHLNPNVYSFGSINGKTLYLTFEKHFINIQNSDFEDIWDVNIESDYNERKDEKGQVIKDGNVMFRNAKCKNGIEYVIFEDPADYM